jgi:hypothetical protein
MSDMLLLAIVLGVLLLALGVDLVAAIGWMRQQYNRRNR